MPPRLPAAARLLMLTALSLLLAAPALAGTSPPGVNLRWDNCFGDAGVWNKTFACNTNSGSESLVGSFELGAPLPQASGVEITIELRSASGALPSWWSMKNTGTCRQTSLNINSVLPASATNCVDWASGASAGGIGAYQIGSQGPNYARIVAAEAVPQAGLADLDPGVEYFAFNLTINHAKTVGTGACAGCDVPVCIFITRMLVTTPISANNLELYRGANYSGSQYATWQNGYPTNVQTACQNPFVPIENCLLHVTTFSCVPYDVTPARTSTWGTLKSLYR